MTVSIKYCYSRTTPGGAHRYAPVRKVAHRPDVGDIYLRNWKGDPPHQLKITLEIAE